VQEFKDAKGRSWKIPKLTIGIIEDVQDATGVNIYQAVEDGGSIATLLVQPFKLVGILWALCSEQASALKVNARDFGRGLDAEAVEKAGEALVEALVDFFPRAAAAKEMKARLRRQMQTLDARLIAHLKSSSGDSPESPESIPGPSVSGD
jgi:hypothetical protein